MAIIQDIKIKLQAFNINLITQAGNEYGDTYK